MGFQVLDSDMFSFEGTTALIIQSRLVIPFREHSDLIRQLIRLGDTTWDAALERARPLEFNADPEIVSRLINVRLAASLLDSAVQWKEEARSIMKRQEIVAQDTLAVPRLFYRFSSSPVDPRVLPDGSWAPGTYGTTYNDLKMVPSGFAAVGRYALPNPHSARYVFPILTASSPIYVGTVTPNFGQAGGGVEVMFPNGATPIPGVPHRIERE